MLTRRPAMRLAVLTLAGVTVAGLFALAAPFASTERLLARGLDEAFAASPDRTERGPTRTQAANAFDPSALRLSAWRERDGVEADAVKIGDRITIGRDGARALEFEVVETRPLDADVTRVEDGPDLRMVLVTGRAIGEPGRLLRFIVEAPAETNHGPVVAAPARAL